MEAKMIFSVELCYL